MTNLWVFLACPSKHHSSLFQALDSVSQKKHRWVCLMLMATTIIFWLSLTKPWMMALSSLPNATSLSLHQMPENLFKNLRWVTEVLLSFQRSYNLEEFIYGKDNLMFEEIILRSFSSWCPLHFLVCCLPVNDALFWLGVRACAWWSYSQGKLGDWAATTTTTGGVQCYNFAYWSCSIKERQYKGRDEVRDEKVL